MTSRNLTLAFELAAALFSCAVASCSSNPSTSGETHFLCGTTSDCAPHGANLECVSGQCVDPNANGNAAQPLTGTWDVVGTELGQAPRNTVVTLSPDLLRVENAGGSLQATLAAGHWAVAAHYPRTGWSPDHSFDAHSNPAAASGDNGVIPFDLFGSWALGSVFPECNAQVAQGSITAGCADFNSPLPRFSPDIRDGNLTATRTETRASVFGDFGGVWTISTIKNAATSQASPGVSCTVTVEGGTIAGQCTGRSNVAGSFSITYEGDTVHGTTSQGIEFTAQRR